MFIFLFIYLHERWSGPEKGELWGRGRDVGGVWRAAGLTPTYPTPQVRPRLFLKSSLGLHSSLTPALHAYQEVRSTPKDA